MSGWDLKSPGGIASAVVCAFFALLWLPGLILVSTVPDEWYPQEPDSPWDFFVDLLYVLVTVVWWLVLSALWYRLL